MTDDAPKRMSLSERLTQTLEVEEQKKKQEIIQEFVADKDTQDDFEYVRQKIKDMVEAGIEAVDHLAEIAKEGEAPRAYEVLANLIKTNSENAEKLLDIRKKKNDLNASPVPTPLSPTAGGTTNNVFVGTTNDVLKMIKDQLATKSKIIDITPVPVEPEAK